MTSHFEFKPGDYVEGVDTDTGDRYRGHVVEIETDYSAAEPIVTTVTIETVDKERWQFPSSQLTRKQPPSWQFYAFEIELEDDRPLRLKRITRDGHVLTARDAIELSGLRVELNRWIDQLLGR